MSAVLVRSRRPHCLAVRGPQALTLSPCWRHVGEWRKVMTRCCRFFSSVFISHHHFSVCYPSCCLLLLLAPAPTPRLFAPLRTLARSRF